SPSCSPRAARRTCGGAQPLPAATNAVRTGAMMRGKVEASVEEFDDAPLSGVRMRKPLPMWRMLIGEVQEQARVTCRDVPDHVRADVESAAMVGLMEAIRDFDE